MAEQVWQYLQISDTVDREFATGLSVFVPVLGWKPTSRRFPGDWAKSRANEQAVVADPHSPALRTQTFPLQKGFSRMPNPLQSVIGHGIARRLLRQSAHPERTPLICSIPYFAGVAEYWPGPVIYYLTDYMAGYRGADPDLVRRLDRRMCRTADLVCANSTRLADYLVSEAGCDRRKVEVVPNATRESNLLPVAPSKPAALPADVADLPRPIAGVIGNMAGNLDWLLLSEMVDRTPGVSWLFVGPTSMDVENSAQLAARQKMLAQGGRVRFIGAKPYGELAAYARGFDFAVIPYANRKPTTFGSPTRLFDHLAACRPILANRNVSIPRHLSSLVHFFDSACEAAQLVQALKPRAFNDGLAELRWHQSKKETWQCRAFSMYQSLEDRLRYIPKPSFVPAPLPVPAQSAVPVLQSQF